MSKRFRVRLFLLTCLLALLSAAAVVEMRTARAATSVIDFPAMPGTAPMGAVDDEQPAPVQPRAAPAAPSSVTTYSRAPGQPANPLRNIPLSGLKETRDRPVFARTRRPPAIALPVMMSAPPVAIPRPPEPVAPPLALVGTVAGSGDGVAVFAETTGRGLIRLRVGESHKDWMLQSIDGRAVTLQRASSSATLSLPKPADQPANLPLALPSYGAQSPPSSLPQSQTQPSPAGMPLPRAGAALPNARNHDDGFPDGVDMR